MFSCVLIIHLREILFSFWHFGVSLVKPYIPHGAEGPQLPLVFYFSSLRFYPEMLIPYRPRYFAPSCLQFFSLMSRLANIVPASIKSFDPCRNLTRSDVAVTATGILVTFKCTKTIQFGERQLHIPLLQIAETPLCPVAGYGVCLK